MRGIPGSISPDKTKDRCQRCQLVKGAWFTHVKCVSRSLGYEQVCTENHWDALSRSVDLLWNSSAMSWRSHLVSEHFFAKSSCIVSGKCTGTPAFGFKQYVKIVVSCHVSLQSTDWRSPFGFEHLHAPQSRCGQDQSFEPSGGEGGERRWRHAGSFKFPRLQRMGWAQSQRFTFPRHGPIARCRSNRSRIFRGGAAAMLLRRAACRDAHGLQKNTEISVWSSVENRKVYESRDVWCLIIHFLGVYTQTSNGPMVPNSYPCPSVSGILVNIHTTAADVASFVSQPVCNLPSPWQLEEIWYCPMWSWMKLAWIGGLFLVWNHPSLLVERIPQDTNLPGSHDCTPLLDLLVC